MKSEPSTPRFLYFQFRRHEAEDAGMEKGNGEKIEWEILCDGKEGERR